MRMGRICGRKANGCGIEAISQTVEKVYSSPEGEE